MRYDPTKPGDIQNFYPDLSIPTLQKALDEHPEHAEIIKQFEPTVLRDALVMDDLGELMREVLISFCEMPLVSSERDKPTVFNRDRWRLIMNIARMGSWVMGQCHDCREPINQEKSIIRLNGTGRVKHRAYCDACRTKNRAAFDAMLKRQPTAMLVARRTPRSSTTS